MAKSVKETISEPEQMSGLLGQPRHEGVRSLYLRFKDTAIKRADEVVGVLAGSPRLAQLEELTLHDNGIGIEGAAALATSPHLGKLRTLNLHQNSLGDAGLIHLANSTTLKSLRGIHLYGNGHTDRTVRALARGPLAARLRELWIGGGNVTWRGARILARTKALGRLRILDLSNTRIGDAGLIEIAQSPHLRRLRELYLRGSGLSGASVPVLAHSAWARRLRVLNLENNDIRDVGAWELVRSPHLQRLEKLALWDCDSLQLPVSHALKERYGERVEIFIGEDEHEEVEQGGQWPGPTTADALLADIRRHPDDDTPRLIYADWLAENGEPERADFIRTGCRLARCEPGDPGRAALARRQKALLKKHEWDWTGGAFLRWLQHPARRCPSEQYHEACDAFARAMQLRQEEREKGEKGAATRQRRWKQLAEQLRGCELPGEAVRLPLFQSQRFERGFIESATVNEVMFLCFAPAVRDRGVVRNLELEVYRDDDMEIADPVVGLVLATLDRPRLKTLGLCTYFTQTGSLRTLAAWRGLSELTSLTGLPVLGDAESDEALQILARSRYLRKLETLEVGCGAYTDAAIDAVLASPYLGNLKRLRLLSDEPQVSEAALERYRARFGTQHPGE